MTQTRTRTTLPPLAPRRSSPVTLAALALGAAALGATAGAEGAGTQLTTAAQAEMTAALPLIVGLLVVGIGITVAFFINKNVKKGVRSAG